MTGNLSDPAALPRVSPQHCLRTRFNGSSCALCLDACPHQAPVLAGVISIDASACCGCLLCASACPVGAIEPRLNAATVTAALNRSLPIVLSCHRGSEECNLRTPCLGFLTEEYLLALHTAATPGIYLNLVHCGECVNPGIVSRLRGVIYALEAKTGLPVSKKVRLVELAADLHFQPETVGRRGFFTTLTRSLLREAASVLTAPALEGDQPASYAKKRLPLRRNMLNFGLDRMSGEERGRIAALLGVAIRRSEACDGCRACTKVCPTGALIEQVADASAPFEFDASRCTGCGLCVEFCLNGALILDRIVSQT